MFQFPIGIDMHAGTEEDFMADMNMFQFPIGIDMHER